MSLLFWVEYYIFKADITRNYLLPQLTTVKQDPKIKLQYFGTLKSNSNFPVSKDKITEGLHIFLQCYTFIFSGNEVSILER